MLNIDTKAKLADFLEIPLRKLTYILYINKPENYYESFSIPKRNGGSRTINAPCGDLKCIQKTLAQKLYDHTTLLKNQNLMKSNISHGFEKNKNIVTNAKVHCNKRYVVNIDLEDFFESFNFGRVKGYFEHNKFFQLPPEIATCIAQLTCYNGHLPQGGPCSPIISNLICQIMDFKILEIARRYKLDYTRYADDLTFSTNRKDFIENYDVFLVAVKNKIEKSGFKLNEQKTRISFKTSQQKVTGLVVNKKINIDKNFYKHTRAMANSLYRNGYLEIDGMSATIQQLQGRFSFIHQINKYNIKIENRNEKYHVLNGKEKSYRLFLFYKFFYANPNTLIITEGKTDPRYLKAALMNLYKDYPDLIQKKESEFIFKVKFLNHTNKNFKYFFNINEGASGFNDFPNYFCTTKDTLRPNLFSYLRKIGNPPQSTVILLFDNDQPLKKFLNSKKYRVDGFEKNLYANIIEGTNLYVLTCPRGKDNEDQEIENLFSKETLSHQIDGKSFTRKENNPNPDRYYGKEIFSHYIESNYKAIDFSQFRVLLDAITKIMKE